MLHKQTLMIMMNSNLYKKQRATCDVNIRNTYLFYLLRAPAVSRASVALS